MKTYTHRHTDKNPYYFVVLIKSVGIIKKIVKYKFSPVLSDKYIVLPNYNQHMNYIYVRTSTESTLLLWKNRLNCDNSKLLGTFFDNF